MKLLQLLLFLLLAAPVCGQNLHAIVYFKDKPNVTSSIENPSLILTQRAIERKQRHNIAIDERDVPVNQAYISNLKNQPGIDYRTQSKWFNAAHVVGTFEDLENLKALDYVVQVDYADVTKSAQTIKINKFSEDIALPADYGNAKNQIEMIGLNELHNQGNTGDGVWIALTDSGYPNVNVNTAFAKARSENRILGGYDFVAGDDSYFGDHFHGARVLSIIAGQVDDARGKYIGSAPDASYFLFRTEDVASETPVEMSYWVAAAERADSLGVDVMNVSLGYLGFDNPNESLTYEDMDGSSFISRGATTATEKGLMVVTSTGNSGNSSLHPWIAAPADAPGVLAIGAVTASGNKSSFSSIGPSRDGRIRPSVVAQGSATKLVEESGALQPGNGTSYSGPIIAGAMACLIQAYPNLSVAELIDAVQKSASQGNNPDNQLGYGIPDFGKTFQTLATSQLQAGEQFLYYLKDGLLYFDNRQNEGSTTFHLFNLQGQQVFNLKTSLQEPIDLNQLSKGLYIFKIGDSPRGFKIIMR